LAAILRHDRVVGLLGQLACAGGVVARAEQSHTLGDNGRLDLTFREFAISGRDVAIDVKLMHAMADSHVTAAAKDPLATARKGEAQKVAKYGARCAAADMEFIPTVWETSGAAAPTTISFFKGLVAQVDRGEFTPPNWAASSPAAYWLQRLGVTIQRYNAFKAINLAASSQNRKPFPLRAP
jgi:hypothetical protein